MFLHLDVTLGLNIANALSGGSAGAGVGIVVQLPAAQMSMVRMAFYESSRSIWIMYVVFAGLRLLMSAFVRSGELSMDHTARKTGFREEKLKRREEKERKRNERQKSGFCEGKDLSKEV